jgi:uncharacterized protein YecT (DUF1311 family)
MPDRPPRFARPCLLLACLLGWLPVQARDRGPSFDCSKARSPVERQICGSPRLAELDAILGRYYGAASASVDDGARTCLSRQQRQWLGQARNPCAGTACLEQAYLQRLAELEPLVPGAVLDRRLEAYPAVPGPRLLAILAADAQQPAPADPLQPVRIQGRALEDEGGYVLVDDGFDPQAWQDFHQLQGDEAGLRARFGEGPLMLPGVAGSFSGQHLDPRGRAAIGSLIAAGGQLQVSGWAEYTDAAAPAVDSRACAYVHALP